MALSGSVTKSDPSAVSMDVLSLLRLLVSHWRVTVPAVLLTLFGVVFALQTSSPTYNATGSIVLLSPPAADISSGPGSAPTPAADRNPFARYGDIAIVNDILTRVMNSDSKRAELASRGVTDFEIVASASGRDPVFEVTGEGPNAEAAIQSTEVVLDEAEAALLELQQAEGADPDYFIESAPLEPPSTATAVYGSTVRSAIAALAVGAVCTLGLAVLAEVVARQRAARRAAAQPSDDAGEGAEAVGSNGTTVGRDVEAEGSRGSFDSSRVMAWWNASIGSPGDEGRGQPTSDR